MALLDSGLEMCGAVFLKVKVFCAVLLAALSIPLTRRSGNTVSFDTILM